MINKNNFPILEFDDTLDALINPKNQQNKYGILKERKLVITFFKEVIKTLLTEKQITPLLTIEGENDVIVYKYVNEDILLIHGIVGSPACAGTLEDLIGLGITKVMFCGGGGVLDKNIKVGELLVVDGAIRDDGLSYHYIKPSRVIYTNEEVKTKIINYLEQENIPFIKGLTWTTDAIYRETKDKIALRKEEGAKIVEMEQSGLIAVSSFRKIDYGSIIYGGDDVSGTIWDDRKRINRKSIRYNLVEICKELVKII